MKWPDLVDHLRQSRLSLMEGNESIVLSCTEVDEQRVRVELVSVFDEPWLLLLSPVVREASAKLRDALTLNMSLAVASLAIDQGYLVLRATMAMENLEAAVLDRTVDFVAREARRLRHLHARAQDPKPWDFFRD